MPDLTAHGLAMGMMMGGGGMGAGALPLSQQGVSLAGQTAAMMMQAGLPPPPQQQQGGGPGLDLSLGAQQQ